MTHIVDRPPATRRGAVQPVQPAAGSRRGAGLDEVTLVDGFWSQRQQVNSAWTMQHCLDWLERLGWLDNFDRVAAGTTGADRPGWQFSDSEVYKLMEALAWEHARTGDPGAGRQLEQLTERVAAAQDPDGYLNTCFGHPGRPPRWSDLEQGHELYCVGHLLQAAVARARTHPDDRLVGLARRAADLVCEVFGADGRTAVCGHPEVELGLVELGRALAEPRYVEQARLFVERRGRGLLGPIPLLGPSYFQDDVPVREADAWRGHAVRALYLSAAAVDVAVDLADGELLAAVGRQWDRSVERRTYITGGMGSRHQDEGFGEDWELPPDRAYCETCAGVASVMVSWRLYLATGEVRYADLIERTLFNVIATSPRADGRAFFYANPLHQRVAGSDVDPQQENPRAEGGSRAPWFDVSCCPTNVARTLASWQAYAVAVDGDVVSLLQYASADVRVCLGDGEEVALRVRTLYPVSGDVDVEVVTAPARPVTLRLRVPDWAHGALVAVDGETAEVPTGWFDLTRQFEPGTTVGLRLPVQPRLTRPDPRVDAVRGCVAYEAGPLVLCLEATDLPDGVGVDEVRVEAAIPPRPAGDGALVQGRVLRFPPGAPGGLPYAAGEPLVVTSDPVEVTLVPYHQWAERAPTAMRVWLPTA